MAPRWLKLIAFTVVGLFVIMLCVVATIIALQKRTMPNWGDVAYIATELTAEADCIMQAPDSGLGPVYTSKWGPALGSLKPLKVSVTDEGMTIITGTFWNRTGGVFINRKSEPGIEHIHPRHEFVDDRISIFIDIDS